VVFRQGKIGVTIRRKVCTISVGRISQTCPFPLPPDEGSARVFEKIALQLLFHHLADPLWISKLFAGEHSLLHAVGVNVIAPLHTDITGEKKCQLANCLNNMLGGRGVKGVASGSSCTGPMYFAVSWPFSL
jgi:hypothetical protein